MGAYRDFETRPPTPGVSPPDGLAPPWLLGPKGLAWLRVMGAAKDGVVARAKEAVKARHPALAPSDALGQIGAERGIPCSTTETEAAYRARLVGAMDAWRYAGTPYGLLSQLRAAGYPNAVVQVQLGRHYSLGGTAGTAADLVVSALAGTTHLGGTPAELWSDFAVVITQPWPANWSGVAPADGSVDQKAVAALIRAWKPGHTRCVALKVAAGPLIGLGITIGSTFIVGGGTDVAWTPPVG